ncbi:ATP-binding protein [Variovorax sp. 3P27G3]|uniref:ATP-binding protein n=1 Tax=Variovorax sp. 3P27G3 TaxID=2502214 RepID=UPI0010F91BDF|nr:ATP-binding protein [Variovorax sp. 3P27G3]
MVELMKITGPIMSGSAFHVETAQTKACCAAILHWLRIGILGGLIVGPARHGKTCAIRWAIKAIPILLGIRIPVFEIPLRSQLEPKERDFFEHLLLSVRHRDWDVGSIGEKRNRFSDFLATKARGCEIKTVFVHFDEAQYLHDQHWEWIQNIENEAVLRKIKVFFLFSGPLELEAAKERCVQRGMSHIVGRFMSMVFYLRGLESEGEIKECLGGFSEGVYPVSGGKKLIAHFVDLQARPDFSLASYAPAMWRKFSSIRAAQTSAAQADDMFVPMHYLTAAVLHFLTELAINTENSTDEVLLENAIEECGFSDFIRSITFQSEAQPKGEP